MKYSVKTLRAAGLEARWTHNRNGAPIIVARNPKAPGPHQRTTWWYVTSVMWIAMQKDGVEEAFNNHTLLGDIFSVGV